MSTLISLRQSSQKSLIAKSVIVIAYCTTVFFLQQQIRPGQRFFFVFLFFSLQTSKTENPLLLMCLVLIFKASLYLCSSVLLPINPTFFTDCPYKNYLQLCVPGQCYPKVSNTFLTNVRNCYFSFVNNRQPQSHSFL